MMAGVRMSKIIPLRRPQRREAETADEALLAACARGDMAALGALFHRYQAAVYSFLSRISGTDDADLDDLVQNTFLQVHRSAARFRHRSSVKSWIFGIAANVARHHVRSSIRQKRAFRILRDAAWTDAGGGVHEAVERRAMMERLSAALGKLSYKLRVVFVMCDMEGVSGVEAARALGLREGTLWRRLHDARQALAVEIEGRSDDGS